MARNIPSKTADFLKQYDFVYYPSFPWHSSQNAEKW